MHNAFCCDFSLGAYDIAEAEGVQRGTKIVVHLRGDCYNYAKEDIIKGKHFSTFGIILYLLVLTKC